MPFVPYRGDRYLDADGVDAFLDTLEAAAPEWVQVTVIGQARSGRPIRLVTLGRMSGSPEHRPAVWVDGGTHAVEWTGVMTALFTVSRWIEGLLGGDEALVEAFTSATAYIVPCISPDGLQATMHGTPSFRSTLRPPRSSTVRTGFDPADLTGDGQVRWMRWRHPAGSWVPVADHAVAMRARTVDDDPDDAWFLCSEGRFVNWDGTRWTEAALQHGLDLNRNFPVDWSPFSMFGMDAGTFPASEPESRAVLEAVASRENIAAAVTNHTYTGCLLTPPARSDCPLPDGDKALMQRLATDLVQGTGYRVFKVFPEFMYDPNKPIIGTWDDTLSTTFGILAYTLELWNPYAWAGVEVKDPVDNFRDPDPVVLQALVDKAVSDGAYQPWAPFEHPQLGDVEVGGIDYLRTVRNPPEPLLAEECARGFTIADRLRKALPRVHGTLSEVVEGELRVVTLTLENLGALSTSSLERAERIGTSPAVRASIDLGPGQQLVHGPTEQQLSPMAGWYRAAFARTTIYPSLHDQGHRTLAQWTLRGAGPVTVRWTAGRAGRGHRSIGN